MGIELKATPIVTLMMCGLLRNTRKDTILYAHCQTERCQAQKNPGQQRPGLRYRFFFLIRPKGSD